MAKIILSEQQFKDYMRIVLKEERKMSYLKNLINEAIGETDVYAEQSDREVSLFIRGLENGSAFVDEKCAAVPYPEDDEYANEEPSRWIVYEYEHQGYLRDDGFSMQHVKLPQGMDRKIQNLIYNNYGVTVPDSYGEDEMLSEGTGNGANVDGYVDMVLNDNDLLNKAIQHLSPRFSMFPNGTQSQQMKWRIDSFISGVPEVFKAIMSIPLRKKIAMAIYNALRMKYRQYF